MPAGTDSSNFHVLKGCKPAKQPRMLKGPPHAESSNLVRRPTGHVAVADGEASCRGPDKAGEDIEKCRLARPVRSDKSNPRLHREGQVDVLKRCDSRKVLRNSDRAYAVALSRRRYRSLADFDQAGSPLSDNR